MSNFDHFQYFFARLKQNDNRNTNSYFVQEMYYRYYRPYRANVSKRQLQKLSEEKRNLLIETFTLCEEYEAEYRKRYGEMCEKLLIDINNKVKNAIPFNEDTFKSFVSSLRLYKDSHFSEKEGLYVGRKAFIEQVATLITFEMYSTPNLVDSAYLKHWFVITEEALNQNRRINNIPFVISRTKQWVYAWCCRLGLQSVIPAKTYRKNGEFLLTWDYVVFADKKINLYHPLNYPFHPYVVINTKSRKAMNGIKSYLAEQCPYLAVHATDGYLDDVYKDDLLDCVEILHQRLHLSTGMRQTHALSPFRKVMSQNEIKTKIHELKSIYLDFLCDSQLLGFKIVYCPESRVNSDGVQTDEDAFIFTIKRLNDSLKLVFENTLDKRASITFICHQKQYNDVIMMISQYFSSGRTNKREGIYQLAKVLKPYHVQYQKVIHIDFYTWKYGIFK